MKQILYIFDYVGMLQDTILDSIHCVNLALKKHNKNPYTKNPKNMIYREFREYLYENGGGKDSPLYNTYLQIYEKYEKPNTKPYPGIIKVLKQLQNQENTTLAICSNKDQKELEKSIKKHYPTINFKHISGHIKGIPDKPDPTRLNKIIQKTQTKRENVVYLGDKDNDIKVAQNAKIKMILNTWGEGNPEDYKHPYPTQIINKPEEILKIKI